LAVTALRWCHQNRVGGRRGRKVKEVGVVLLFAVVVPVAVVVRVIVLDEVEDVVDRVVSEWRHGLGRWWSDVKDMTFETTSREGWCPWGGGCEGRRAG
jgi:hypothetical protein